MKQEFLLEIGTEEIPAGYIPPALKAAKEMLSKTLENERIEFEGINTAGGPRRLIIQAQGVAESQETRIVEKTGPPKAQAFDSDGKPTKAAMGFAKSQGVKPEDLELMNTPKGEVVGIRKEEIGRPTIDILAEKARGLIESMPFPKTMRWMDMEARFARPVHWIVALFGEEIVPFEFGGVKSAAKSRGHRFTHPEEFTVSSFDDLATSLEERNVIISSEVRKEMIEHGVEELAHKRGLTINLDADLLDEITYLVERPYPVIGTFAEDFLELPADILTTCMKKHQRYFSVLDESGKITNHFVAVNNTPVKDENLSVQGHERVLKARLEDARFYFNDDRKKPLIERLEALKGVVFHSKLGTSYEKVVRFTHLAALLARQFAPVSIAHVERAAQLAKCDLETGIVYEFPELQGIIGSYYAKMDGEPQVVAEAVREHYLPASAGDELPSNIVASIVSLADRIDTITGCFSVGMIPTGAADPYALRRHALGVIQILINVGKPLNLSGIIREGVGLMGERRIKDPEEIQGDVKEFIRTRFVNLHVSLGYPLDVVESVVRAGFDDVVDARARVDALTNWKRQMDVDSIIIGFKRAANILKDTEETEVSKKLLKEKAEKDLFNEAARVEKQVAKLVSNGDYTKVLEIMSELKAPIDEFFDHVMVMVDDDALRNNRLGLLRKVASMFSSVADFSFIGSTAEKGK